jgi:peptidoglycan hydrolase-like protein with peptidoglycan-binding domain
MIDPQALAAGDEGELVEELQRRLGFLNYYNDDISGRYEDSTVNAVKEFQTASGLTDDGAMSLEAWSKLEDAATQGGFYDEDPAEGGDAADDGGMAPGTLSDDGQYQWDGENWQAVGGDTNGESSGEMLSEDGQYRWDGEAWVPVDGAQPATDTSGGDSNGETSGEILSEDGQYRWDGEAWIPVNGEQPAEQPAQSTDQPADQATDPAAVAANTKVLTEDQFGKMVSESLSVAGEA